MTKVVYNHAGDAFALHMFGHAGLTEVCNACSILSFTAIASAADVSRDLDYNTDKETGSMTLFFRTYKTEKAETVMDTVMHGFSLLAEKYPDNVSVQVEKL